VTAASTGGVPGLVEEGKLIVVTTGNFPPFTAIDPDSGEVVGYTIDIARSVAERLGLELETPTVDWVNELEGLAQGLYDIADSGIWPTAKRQESFLFSRPMTSTGIVAQVRAADAGGPGFADMTGMKAGGIQGSSQEAYMLENADALGYESYSGFAGAGEALTALKQGRVDALSQDTLVAGFASVNDPELAVAGPTVLAHPLSLAFQLGQEAKRDAVNAALDAMIADGTLAELQKKWFNTCIPVPDHNNQEEPYTTMPAGDCGPAVTAASSGAGEGGTVTLLYWQAASTLNPYLSGGWKDRDAGSVILEPLAEFDDQGVLVPALATEIPTVANGGVAEDLKSITWTLLEGVLWSDGTPVTSDDVVFSWEYCSHPDTGCANAGSFEGVTSVEAVDDLTITVNFAEATPFPYVPFVSNSLPVIQRAQFGDCVGAASAECTDQNFAPIGTGPFKIESFTTNDTAVYVINENYRGVSEGKPYFGRVVIKGGGDAPATARSVLELGESDYAWNLQVEPEILAAMVSAGKGTVVSAFSTMVERIMVNQTNPDPALGDDRSEYMDGGNPHPFLTDPVVGRALSIAIDRQTLVDVGYGDAGRPTCNVWPAPPAQNSTANDECLTQDIDLANQLLDDAGYADTDGDGVRESPDGVPLEILYQTSTNTVRQATQELIKQDWAKIGVETELRNIDASVFFGGDPASPDTYGKFYSDIQMYTNGAAGVDSQSYMGSWTTSNISGKDTTWQGSNVQRFQSDEYDALHAELTQTADMDRRNEITIQLNDLVVGNYSIIPLIHRGSVSAHANSLTGVKLNPWDAELWNIGDWARN
jgi:peptide/nickel transport system substrate-binding protein